MHRIPEPELMDEAEQARAYAEAQAADLMLRKAAALFQATATILPPP